MSFDISELSTLKNKIPQCRMREQYLFRSQLSKLKQGSSQKTKNLFNKLQQDIDNSMNYVNKKRNNLSEITYNQDLPIYSHVEEISRLLNENQLIVVCGETGSGKTTQLPKICLAQGYGAKGLVGHTQPRRLAAKSIANRLAKELDMPLGKGVGYKIRHNDKTSDETYIKLMTDGVLLAEMQKDRWLNDYEVLIIDEAHERSLNIDFILGYLKRLLPKRPDLKVIITSATIDVEQFSEHFNDAPIIQVEGRTYPVEVRYRPLEDAADEEAATQNVLHDAITELGHVGLGDILVFLPGEREIHEMLTFLRKQSLSNTEILPLYSRLTSEGQSKIFKPHNKRHIILATNVAETSLTIPGISFVIDLGYAKISRYSYKSKIQRLPVEKISQAAANQRKGRCGRTHEGVCIRLYSEDDFEQRSCFTEPEILRTNLATVILQMKSMRLGDISDFPFITKPNQRYINDGLRLLTELSALDKQQELTAIGKELSRLPVEPRFGRMLIAAKSYHCVNEILIIISALSILDPRERPLDEPGKADEAHKQFDHQYSDFLRYINLWQFYQKQSKQLSKNQLKKLCKTNYLSFNRMNEWQDIHRQLKDIVKELKYSMNSEAADYNNIHCAIIAGLLSHLAIKDDEKNYLGARGSKLNIFPGSSQFKVMPKWIMSAEIAETSKLFARTVAKIDPKWVLKPAKHLVQRSYTEPHWDDKKQQITAYESISLYGLVIVAKQPVNFGKINSQEARKLFIEEAFINLKLNSDAKYYMHNKTLIENARLLEAKTRRQDKLDESVVFEFYDNKLPVNVCSLQTLDGWRKKIEKEDREYLFIQDNDLLKEENLDDSIEHLFPDSIVIQKSELPITYNFSPESKDDGASLEVPIILLNKLDESIYHSIVPGLSKQRLTYLLKSLPKSIRKQFVPLPEFVDECEKNISYLNGNIVHGLIEFVFKTRGIKIKEKDFDVTSIPEHLLLNIKIIDEEGSCIAEGRDVKAIKSDLAEKIDQLIDVTHQSEFERDNIEVWDFPDLPVSYISKINDIEITLFPALLEKDDVISIKSFDVEAKAELSMRNGLNKLFQKYLRKDIKYVKKNLLDNKIAITLLNSGYSKEQLIQEIIYKTIEHSFIDKYSITRTKQGFDEILQREQIKFIASINEFMPLISDMFKQYQTILRLLRNLKSENLNLVKGDIQSQMDFLMPLGFIKNVPYKWLEKYPKYLSAIIYRIEKLDSSLKKDQQNLNKLLPYWSKYIEMDALQKKTENFDKNVFDYRWMIEEFRISLFAQEMKTNIKISPERLDKQLNIIRNHQDKKL